MTGDRLDKWLFQARFCKTRALAQKVASSGQVRLNGNRVEKSAHILRPGDVLTLGMGSRITVLRVLGLADGRGPAPEARKLYEIVAD